MLRQRRRTHNHRRRFKKDCQVTRTPIAVEESQQRTERRAENSRLSAEIINGEPVIVEEITTFEIAQDRQPWERQPDETDREWDLFRAWRDLDPHERTYDNAWRVLLNIPMDEPLPDDLPEDTRRCSCVQIAKTNRWRDRVNQYDNHVDAKIREQLQARRIRARLETADLGRAMREKAHEATVALKAIVMVEEDGKMVPRSSLSPNAIAKLAKVGRELEDVALEGGVQGAGPMVGIQINIGDHELRQEAKEIIDAQEQVVDVTSQLIDTKRVGNDNA
jgi:hypothetical protein